MDKLPQDSSENESLHGVIPEESLSQGNLNVQIRQEGYTNYVYWSTSEYNTYPYVTITRQDGSSGLVTLLNHSYKHSPPYTDIVGVGKHVYTVALSNGSQIGIQETVGSLTVSITYKPIGVPVEPEPPIGVPVEPEPLPIFPIEKQPIEHAPVEIIHELPLTNTPPVVSEEQIQE
jgi:hypothetical protein